MRRKWRGLEGKLGFGLPPCRRLRRSVSNLYQISPFIGRLKVLEVKT